MKILHNKNAENFALNISNILKLDISDFKINKFPDGEFNIKIYEDFFLKEVLVIGHLFPNINENLLELLFLINAAKRKGARKIHAVIPYFPYSRMDHKVYDEDFISASCVASLLEAAGLSTLVTVDLHSSQIEGFFRIPVKNIEIFEIFQESFVSFNQTNMIVVSPDLGGKARSSVISKALAVPVAVLYKQRDEKSKVEMSGIMGDVEGKDVMLIDDMTSTGGTLIKAIDVLKNANIRSINLFITHNLLGILHEKRLFALMKRVNSLFTSNTIDVQNKGAKNLKVVDISEVVIKYIQKSIA